MFYHYKSVCYLSCILIVYKFVSLLQSKEDYTSDIRKHQEGYVQFLLPNLGHYLSRGKKSCDTNVAVFTEQEVLCRRDAKTSLAQGEFDITIIYVVVEVASWMMRYQCFTLLLLLTGL